MINDFVTEVDQAAEKVIIETLLAAYPGHGIWAEESGREHGAKDSEFVWIIDPLDGTTNFIHGLPFYCVSIALAVKGKIEQAVIYDPTRNDLFTATKGRGAYLNDRRLRVSKRIRMQEALISTGFPFRPGDDFNTYLRMMGDMMQRTAGLRRPGPPRSIWPMWRLVIPMDFLNRACTPGMQQQAPCWSPKRAGWWATSPARPTFWSKKNAWRATPAIYGQMVTILGKYSKFANAGEKAGSTPSAR
jgi:myo-inositol-1(or 4)-monophosphatase